MQLKVSRGIEEKSFKNRRELFENAKQNGYPKKELYYFFSLCNSLLNTVTSSTIAPPTAERDKEAKKSQSKKLNLLPRTVLLFCSIILILYPSGVIEMVHTFFFCFQSCLLSSFY